MGKFLFHLHNVTVKIFDVIYLFKIYFNIYTSAITATQEIIKLLKYILFNKPSVLCNYKFTI